MQRDGTLPEVNCEYIFNQELLKDRLYVRLCLMQCQTWGNVGKSVIFFSNLQ